MKYENKEKISNLSQGSIIKFRDKKRLYVALPANIFTDTSFFEKVRRNIKDHTGYYLVSCIDKNTLHKEAFNPSMYHKSGGQLKLGMLPNIEIVGNISNIRDFQLLLESE